MASKKLKQIMAFDDQLFRAMSPEQFGKGPPALRTIKQKPKPQQKKDSRKPNHGVSQFDVLPLGVLDALSTSLLRASQGNQEVNEEMDEIESVEQGSQAPSPAETIPTTGTRAAEAKASPTASPKLQSSQPSIESSQDVDFGLGETDQGADLDSLFNQETVSPPSFSTPKIDTPLASIGIPEASEFETPEAMEVRELADDEFQVEQDSVPDLVKSRRDRAQIERKAAAENFQEQQAQPILGIPNPAPMRQMELDGQKFDSDGNALGEEKGLGMDAVVSQATEFAQHTVSVMDKLTMELMAISVRVRNIENLLDRM